MTILETDRLILREMEQADFPDLAEMLKNQEVMYAYEHEFSDDDVQAWLNRQLDRYKKDGFGLWAIILKNTGEMVGQAGLTMQSYKDMKIPEIGYLLKKQFWHHGYAKEAAMGCKKFAFMSLNIGKVYSIIKTDNLASMKVAESIGMKKEDEFIKHCYGIDMPHFLYAVQK